MDLNTYKQSQERRYIVGCIYRSPNSSGENNSQLLQLLKAANTNIYTNILILGDFNFHPINRESEQVNTAGGTETVKFIDAAKDNFLFQHIKVPTHCRSGYTPNILDLVFTRDEDTIEQLLTEAPLGLSDHSVVSLRICCDKEMWICISK